MKFPISTGQAAQMLGTTEPRLAETVRRGKIDPRPPVVAGRRLWSLIHVYQAAKHIGIPVEELAKRLRSEARHA